MMDLRKKLIQAGVRNLKQFGYPSANEDNILTDQIFGSFFLNMLKDHKGPGVKEAAVLIKEIENEEAVKAILVRVKKKVAKKRARKK